MYSPHYWSFQHISISDTDCGKRGKKSFKLPLLKSLVVGSHRTTILKGFALPEVCFSSRE